MPKSQLPKYDLEERTAKFAEKVITLCRKLPQNTITIPLINQLVKAASSVAANYCEADDAESKKDFKHKIGIVKKESRESKLHLRLIAVAVPNYSQEINSLRQEAKELNLIFNAIFKKVS